MVEATLKAIERVLELRKTLPPEREGSVLERMYTDNHPHFKKEWISHDGRIGVIPRSEFFGSVWYEPTTNKWWYRSKSPLITIHSSINLLDRKDVTFSKDAIKKALHGTKYKTTDLGENRTGDLEHTYMLIKRKNRNVGRIRFNTEGRGGLTEAELVFEPEHAIALAKLVLSHEERKPLALLPGRQASKTVRKGKRR